MVRYFMEKSGKLEVFIRRIATISKPIKKLIKRLIHNRKRETSYNKDQLLQRFKEKLSELNIGKDDIVIVHSSMDGLNPLGVNGDVIVRIIMELFKGATVVFAAFPVESKRKKEEYKYNPQKTLSGTGVLPNLFLKMNGVVRSAFPFNSLAATGQFASEMMEYSLQAKRPHDCYSPWEFCRKKHAKILFLGTTSRESNTMAMHMVPDMMGDDWPIEGWYTTRKYKIILDEKILEKEIEVQDGFWYQFVNEYKTDRLLKDSGYVKDVSVENVPIEIVEDSYKMMNFLMERSIAGNIMYSIPKRYYKTLK